MKRGNVLTAYHGTDETFLQDIMNNGFIINNNSNHWLGNGIYFYLDYELAKWWSNSPTKKFGNSNKNPIVIKVEIISTPINTLDTRILDDYKYLLELYDEFFSDLCKNGTVVDEIEEDTLRCMFFDWVHSQCEDVEIFIAGFNKKKISPNNSYDLTYKFKIPYIEYQICVFTNDLIIKKERVK